MNSIIRPVAVVAGLVLLLNVTPSWGQATCQSPGCNPTTSDANFNTAGGTMALGLLPPPMSAGFSNTAFGYSALGINTTGTANTAIGTSALGGNSTGVGNTATGAIALNANKGSYNTATGGGTLLNNTTGSFNTAIGADALQLNTTGEKNIALGKEALFQSTGNKNIAIGFRAGVTLTTGNNNIYIGNQGNGDELQTIRIGTAQTSMFIAGINTASVGNAAAVIIDTATGQLGIPTSSARYKRDIAPMGTSSEKVLALRPVTFAYKSDAQGVTHYGLVAEEVAAVYPELVTHTATGEVQAVRYQELVPMLLNELQRHRHEFQQALQNQQKELAELRALVSQGRETASLAR